MACGEGHAIEKVKPGCVFHGDHLQSRYCAWATFRKWPRSPRQTAPRSLWTVLFPLRCCKDRLAEPGPTSWSTAPRSILRDMGTCWAGSSSAMRSITKQCRMLSRVVGGTLGPFESYLTMRGIKTLALRFERQCRECGRTRRMAWLAHPKVDKVNYCGDPNHPDAADYPKSRSRRGCSERSSALKSKARTGRP